MKSSTGTSRGSGHTFLGPLLGFPLAGTHKWTSSADATARGLVESDVAQTLGERYARINILLDRSVPSPRRGRSGIQVYDD